VLKGDDKDVIETKTRALAEASAAIAQQAYAGQQAGGGDAGGAGGAGGGAQGGTAGSDEVLDAEFEEVKDKDRKDS
jgi:molecular chaperone DnaK